MPLYPFTCSDCGAEFDALVTVPTAVPEAECPTCGGSQVTRGLGVPARPASGPRTNCRGDGPPCGARECGRTRNTHL